jgi:hypothetical protein
MRQTPTIIIILFPRVGRKDLACQVVELRLYQTIARRDMRRAIYFYAGGFLCTKATLVESFAWRTTVNT